MARTTVNDQEVRTDDLALATTLRCEGFEPRDLVLEQIDGSSVGIWRFDSNALLREVVRDYQNGDALIEPLKYNRCLRETRRRLFDLLRRHGVSPKPSSRA